MKLPDLCSFENIVIFTGAGMSAESGVPTYRGAGGIWSEYRYQEYACQQAFDLDPEKVWKFHELRRRMVHQCQPNAGHVLVAEMQASLEQISLITQNIDGLHQRAGSDSVTELHGSLWRVRCEQEKKVSDALDVNMPSLKCECGAWLRPDITWFGDSVDIFTMELATTLAAQCDMFISIGTSGVVFPAANLPIVAKNHGAFLIEINTEATEASHLHDLELRGKASDVLAKIWNSAC